MRQRLAGESHVGLLLPASVGGALANVGVSLAGKIPVNLNFTAGKEAMAVAVERCGIRTTLTSRTFLSKVGIEPAEGMIFLEDLLKTFSGATKLRWDFTASSNANRRGVRIGDTSLLDILPPPLVSTRVRTCGMR